MLTCFIEFINLVPKRLRKTIKCETCQAFYDKMLDKSRILSFSLTRLINSIKHDYLCNMCKILYVHTLLSDIQSAAISKFGEENCSP